MVSGLNTEEVAGDWRNLSEELHDCSLAPNVIGVMK